MVKSKRYFRTSITLSQDMMETVFAILKGEEAYQFQTVEIMPSDPKHPHFSPMNPPDIGYTVKPIRQKPLSEMKWAVDLFPHFKPVFLSAKMNGHTVRTRDPQLTDIMTNIGRDKQGITPLLTAWVRAGLIVRTHRGEYKLP